MPSDKVKIGDRVMVVTNEDEPIMIGEVIGFENFGKIENNSLPLVREEKTEKEYVCLGIVKKYSQKLLQELESLSYIDRWNRLAKNKIIGIR